DAAVKNVGRGNTDFGIYEIATVARLKTRPGTSPLPPHAVEPEPADLAAIYDSVPEQPEKIGTIIVRHEQLAGVDAGGARSAVAYDYADAIALVHRIAQVLEVDLAARAETGHAPWHPGRCAAFYAGERLIGHAGELAPK